MIGPIIFLASFAASWLFCGYVAAGSWYREFQEQSFGTFLAGPIALGVSTEDILANGVCWNWITKPDLSAPPKPKWPPDKRTGLHPCLKCNKNTSDSPVGEPLCAGACFELYLKAGGARGGERNHRKAMKKVMGPNYVPPNPQNGQLAASQKEYCSVCGLSSSYVRSGICMTCIARNVRPSDLATRSGSLPTSQISEPIVAYRVWNLDRATMQLKSCTQDYLWPLRKKICRDVFNNKGVHAVKHLSRVLDDGAPSLYNPTGFPQGLWTEYKADVAGEVYLWGEVTEYQLGYKAEFAYPKSLWVPEDTDPMVVMKLEENYGVPVEMRKEFKKLVRSNYTDYASFAFPPTTSGLFTYKCQKCGTYYSNATCPTCAAQLLPAPPVHSCASCSRVLDSMMNCQNVACADRFAVSKNSCRKCGASYPQAFSMLCYTCEKKSLGAINASASLAAQARLLAQVQLDAQLAQMQASLTVFTSPLPLPHFKPDAIVPYDPTAGAGPKP